MKSFHIFPVCTALLLSAVLAACGDDDPVPAPPPTPDIPTDHNAGTFSIYNKTEEREVSNGEVVNGDTLIIHFTPHEQYANEQFATTITVNGTAVEDGGEYIVSDTPNDIHVIAMADASSSERVVDTTLETDLSLVVADQTIHLGLGMTELVPYVLPILAYTDADGQDITESIAASDFSESEYMGTLFHTYGRDFQYKQPLCSSHTCRVTYVSGAPFVPEKNEYYFNPSPGASTHLSYTKDGILNVKSNNSFSIDISIGDTPNKHDIAAADAQAYIDALCGTTTTLVVDIDRDGKMKVH